ncbi:hypothetical protein KOAAANKH_01011 [Brevundimonas sp. NIBR10]|uniref:hypothetical protein n=1 Tax=Brevundimonas sp. NIBR10 TaxID=3015997 RepID=UPI0022F1609E|nr:hypothetical protein [Brevundimonas sp. NIBR10]WGM46145.1 hypothetical protein KOAAANKH_01011 [Brevundimonas sp. NIBR10]
MLIMLALIAALQSGPTPQQQDAIERIKCQVAAAQLASTAAYLRPPELEQVMETASAHDQAVRFGQDWPAGTAAALALIQAPQAEVDHLRALITTQARAGTDQQAADIFSRCVAHFGASPHQIVSEDDDGW